MSRSTPKLKSRHSDQKNYFREETIKIPKSVSRLSWYYRHIGEEFKVRLFWKEYEYKLYRVSHGEHFNDIIYIETKSMESRWGMHIEAKTLMRRLTNEFVHILENEEVGTSRTPELLVKAATKKGITKLNPNFDWEGIDLVKVEVKIIH